MVGARVLLGQITGRCSKEFTDLLRRDLLAHGIPVETQATRDNSPEVVISVEISRCEALPREPLVGAGLPAMHIARTEGHFLGALRVQDAASGDELVTQTLRADPSKENQSQTSLPEYPAPADLIDIAQRQALGQTRRLYEPWVEDQEVTFMDDKDCGLRQELELFKAAKYVDLLQAARSNAESCQANAKTSAAAWYNLGVAYMLMQNYDGALAAFDKTGKLRGSGPAAQAIAECRTDKGLAQALSRHVVAWVRQTQKGVQPGKPVQTGIIFTNDLVLRLVQGSVDDQAIVAMIRTEPDRFSLANDDLAKLKHAGVPDTVIVAMQQKAKAMQ